MAASDQVRRRIVRNSKYRRIARVVQHNDARAVISNWLRGGSLDASKLVERATSVRNKLADRDFDQEVNRFNADYILRFSKVCENVDLTKYEILRAPRSTSLNIGGLDLTFTPSLMLQRLTRTNKVRTGAIMLRYAKGKTLDEEVALHQSSAMFGAVEMLKEDDAFETEKKLCVTIDAHSGATHIAPGNATYRFNQMKAACATIAEQWPLVAAPANAVL